MCEARLAPGRPKTHHMKTTRPEDQPFGLINNHHLVDLVCLHKLSHRRQYLGGANDRAKISTQIEPEID